MPLPEGTVLRSQTPSLSSLSRISQLNIPAFSRLYSSIFFSTSGVVTCFRAHGASGSCAAAEPGLPRPRTDLPERPHGPAGRDCPRLWRRRRYPGQTERPEPAGRGWSSAGTAPNCAGTARGASRAVRRERLSGTKSAALNGE